MEKLFYEDFKRWQKLLMVIAIVSLLCPVGMLISMVVNFAIGQTPTLETYDLVHDITFGIILLALSILCFVWLFKSKALKYTITITEDEIIFNSSFVSVGVKERYATSGLSGLEDAPPKRNVRRIKLIFKNDNPIIIPTQKYKELKPVLDSLLKRNRYAFGR